MCVCVGVCVWVRVCACACARVCGRTRAHVIAASAPPQRSTDNRHWADVRCAMCWVPSRADRDVDQAGAPKSPMPGSLGGHHWGAKPCRTFIQWRPKTSPDTTPPLRRSAKPLSSLVAVGIAKDALHMAGAKPSAQRICPSVGCQPCVASLQCLGSTQQCAGHWLRAAMRPDMP